MEGKAVSRDKQLRGNRWLPAMMSTKSRYSSLMFWWRCVTALIVVTLACSGVIGTIQSVGALSTTVVISQFQIG